MSTLLAPERTATEAAEDTPTPAPLRLPKFLLAHLAKPLASEDDVDKLIVQIRMAEYRGLL